ncbi:ABC transporter permease [Rhodococcus tukisamuensis]|uniref:Putative spermidine/putrescine transport system permease protein n=1 Tax=Rhodococcus tukisamuensis TaxID=168276 RepID=A0A1G6WFD1_9NOCA|nr:ABC transporter permease subunit [Rhodococcus tukisamuensis]SDD64572.1 putative spermidine/putrescine transport system permease protein [Rhodococcus tukisamuensis]
MSPQPRVGRLPAALQGISGLIPFLAFTAVFLGLPLIGLVVSAFLITDPDNPRSKVFSLDNFRASFTGSAGDAMLTSLGVSLVAATIATVLGVLLTQAIVYTGSERLQKVTTVLSSVLANSGGVSLAFSFIVVLGSTGVLTSLFSLDETSFSLYSAAGLVLMYQYFLIPTMVMVSYPTMAALRQEWKDAAAALGATPRQFWRTVGVPIVLPAVTSGFVLLFGASLATHVSAAALVGGAGFSLITLKIAGALSGGNAAGLENVAMAMSVNLVLIAAVTLLAYLPLQRRSRAWLS